jgi:transposase
MDQVRGDDHQQAHMFSYVAPEQRVPQDHPLRAIRKIADVVFEGMSSEFDKHYAQIGRPSIAPEKLLRALLLQALYSVRSERLLMEELDYNMLFRWFVGLNMDDRVWDPTTFTKNRKKVLSEEMSERFFAGVLEQANGYGLLSDEHFTVDGTLLEASASFKSFKRKEKEEKGPTDDDPGNPNVDFHGEKRSNETHQSTTDPEARLARKGKGKEAKLSYTGHLLMENRNGLAVYACVTEATGTAEREIGVAFAEEISGQKRVTLGGDKNYDTQDFVKKMRELKVTPHVAQNDTNRKSAIDGRTTRHEGYQVSQKKRKRVEEIFGWLKTVGPMRKLRHRGTEQVGSIFIFATAAYNLVRMRKLITA